MRASSSIRVGAERAHLAIGAASKRMADLEASIGVQLFERHARGVALTAAGEALERHTQRILNDMDRMTAEMSDYAAGVVGVVRLWANTSSVTQFLPTDIAAFSVVHPDIRIELEEQDSEQVALAVVDGAADFGIMADRMPTLGLQAMLYRKDHLFLVVPDGHPLTQRESVSFVDALEFDFVSLARNTSLAKRLQAATAFSGGQIKLRIQVRSFDAMCLMVAAGPGIAILPDAAVGPHLRSMDLCRIPLSENWTRRELFICARDLNALPRPASLLVNHLIGATPDAVAVR
ncbi:LysR substrate-binding domain-containing protein [Paraburkholderia xenovorans]|uniref:Transcriptional regulator, LysR family n=1 Tax=Paraburkholderia xenovorans (strain LB400) TaxID=266265 RepID=Q140K8_PARXL|nr:transcriptional regulator, LysR family [Paraburkholderia xenovorans LB400]